MNTKGFTFLSKVKVIWVILHPHEPFWSQWDNHNFNFTLSDLGLEMTIYQRHQGYLTSH